MTGVLARTMAMAASVLTVACAHAPAQPAENRAQESRDVELVTPTGVLHGTLLEPSSAAITAGGGARAAALIIPGSGPTDRDGNSAALPGRNNSLLMLAEALATEGIATLRIDKRAIAASAAAGATEDQLRFQHYVDDAVAWVNLLRQEGRYDRVYIIGHSEGALVAKLAAQRAPVAGLVSVAGMGRSLATTVRGQLAVQLPAEMMLQVDTIFAAIRANRSSDIPPMLASLFRPSVQPYLRSVMDIDPATELARVSVPVLIVQGTTDVQISVAEDAERLRAAAAGADYVVIEGMNHVLKRVSGPLQQQIPSYGDPSLPIVPELVEAIVTFMRRR